MTTRHNIHDKHTRAHTHVAIHVHKYTYIMDMNTRATLVCAATYILEKAR